MGSHMSRNDGSPGVSKNRWVYLDLLKIGGILAVILVHQTAPYLTKLPVASGQWQIAAIWNVLARFCVPVFVMASGAVLLDPARCESIGRFLNKRLMKVLIPLLFWETFYFFAYLSAAGEPFSAAQFVRELLAGFGTAHIPDHLWFIPMIVGLYLATPVLRLLTAHGSRGLLKYFLVLCLLFAGLIPVVEQIWHMRVGLTAPMFTGFVGYFVLGYVLHSRSDWGGWRTVALCAVAFAVIAGFTVWATVNASGELGRFTPFWGGYLRPNVVAMSICVYLIFQGMVHAVGPVRGWGGRFAAVVAPTVFGIHLIHPLVMRGLKMVADSAALPGGAMALPLWAAAVFCVSMAVVWGMRKQAALRALVP